MTLGAQRPLERPDYQRLHVVLLALQLKGVFGEDRPLWEILRDLHESSPPAGLSLDEFVGDAGASAEVQRALIVAEALVHGTNTMPARAISAVSTICSTRGCPNTKHTVYCWQC